MATYVSITPDSTKYPSTTNAIRVPTVSSDSGTWGYILNNLLATSLAVTNSNAGANTQGVTAGFLTNVMTLTAAAGNITYTAQPYPGEVILCTCSATYTMTVTLPDATKTLNLYTVKKTDSTTGVVTINTTSSQTIDGGSTAVLRVQYASITLASDGTNWNVI